MTRMDKDPNMLPAGIMGRWRSPRRPPAFHRWLVRIVLIGGAVLGWLAARWIGVLIGLAVVGFASLLLWARGHYVAAGDRYRAHFRDMAKIPTDALRRMVRDPVWPDAGFAHAELVRRGIDERPSLESIFALLTSPDSQRRALGLVELTTVYPELTGQTVGCSSADPPELWRERVELLRHSSQAPPAEPPGMDAKA